ncbi:aldo/keto reductase [Microvirga antarctica]|uniref:aldo/keto reductase n=1 Tax=Microvirga antarctica TaxID=2819233 RepID=UPI001B311411|nr:aldo/keto reductase [Microvirga antarctica]
MKTTTIGALHLPVARLGLGCMSFAGVYGNVDEDEVSRTVQAALDLGANLFDTADVYGAGVSEKMLGQALRGRRQEAVICTKFGNIDHAGAAPVAEAYAGRWETCGRPDYVRSACEKSLRNLGVETIDLYYVHRIDPTVPIEETIGAMADLVQAGKIRAIGLSEAGAETIRRAHATHPLAALQSEYSLWSREPEDWAIPLCQELGMAFVGYSPLGRGFLTGAVPPLNELSEQDSRRHQPRFEPQNYAANRRLLDILDEAAISHGCSKAQVALAWMLAQAPNVLAIPGSKSVRHLRENVASERISLTTVERETISAAFPRTAALGERYPDVQMTRIGL